jgi:hypothetical protein
MPINIFELINNSLAPMPLIPLREDSSTTGSQFVKNNMTVSRVVRQQNILSEVLAGNIPDFLRKFKPITVSLNDINITYLVMPDFICIGNDQDYVRMPMNPHTAQKIADAFDCTLPTRKMVNDIWKASINKLPPLPWGPPYDASMMSMSRVGIHNDRIQAQLNNKDYTALTSGHKKDVVLTNRLNPNNPKKRVAIYGWIQPNGQPIQGLNPVDHEESYEDYSHGIRLIANDVIVNGKLMGILDVFSSKDLSSLVSDEGILTFTKY